jgi:excisionase family DNA binding protein
VSEAASPLGRTSPLGEPLVTADDVAAYLGVDRATVYRLAGRPGGIAVVEVAPRVRRFRPEDVRAYLASRTIAPVARPRSRRSLFGGTT